MAGEPESGDHMIDRLSALVPDPARADRTRVRCHKRLIRQKRSKTPRPFGVDRAIFLGFGAVYLSAIAFDVMRVLIR